MRRGGLRLLPTLRLFSVRVEKIICNSWHCCLTPNTFVSLLLLKWRWHTVFTPQSGNSISIISPSPRNGWTVLWQPPLSNTLVDRRLSWEILWLHIARSAPDEDHHRAVAAVIRKPPSDWKRPPGRPNHTWLRAIESDLRPLNIGPFYTYAWKKAASREHWRSIVDTATLKNSMP